MLSNETKDEIRNRLKAISEAMPAFRSRQGQRVMIAEVAKALARCPDRAADGTHVSPAPGEAVVITAGRPTPGNDTPGTNEIKIYCK